MGANQHAVTAFQKRTDRVHLAAIRAGRVAKVPPRLNLPIRPKTELRQWFIGKAGPDGFFWHDDDRLLQALIVQLVQRDEHQRPAFAASRGRLDQKVLLSPLFIGALLHDAHAEFVGRGRTAVAGIRDGDRGDTIFLHHSYLAATNVR